MDYKLKLLILACTITGSLSILCDQCADNFVENSTLPSCSSPLIRNCSVNDNDDCIAGSPNYDNCTRDTILGCFNGTIEYTDGNGTQKTALYRDCSFSSSVDVCGQASCNDTTESAFNQTSSTATSCVADCCFSDRCNQEVAAGPSASSAQTTAGASTGASTEGPSTVGATTANTTGSTSKGAPSPILQASCLFFLGLSCLGVFVLF